MPGEQAWFWGARTQNQMSFQELSAVPLSTCPDAWPGEDRAGGQRIPCHPVALVDFMRFSLWEADHRLCFLPKKPEMSWKLNERAQVLYYEGVFGYQPQGLSPPYSGPWPCPCVCREVVLLGLAGSAEPGPVLGREKTWAFSRGSMVPSNRCEEAGDLKGLWGSVKRSLVGHALCELRCHFSLGREGMENINPSAWAPHFWE